MGNWVLVALPMFVFMGLMLDRSGMAESLMRNFVRLFGAVRGGLAVTVALIGLLLAASTGIIGASVVLLALLGLPVMLRDGYAPSFAAGTVCAVGTLGILVPPSIMLVLMADRLAMSVGDLFLGALFPGLLLAALYVLWILFYARLNPACGAGARRRRSSRSRSRHFDVLRAVLPPAGLILRCSAASSSASRRRRRPPASAPPGATLLASPTAASTGPCSRDVLDQTSRTTAFIFAVFLGATPTRSCCAASAATNSWSARCSACPSGRTACC